MKFTLAWLKEHLDTDATLDAITFALTDLGLEVESVTNPAARLAAFTVGEVIAASPHPDADKLRVCRVATAGGEKQPGQGRGPGGTSCFPVEHLVTIASTCLHDPVPPLISVAP